MNFLKSYHSIILAGFFCCNLLNSYDLPPLNLGLTNILDGGPVRPTPGFYWQQFGQYYHTKNFLNAQGDPLGGVKSPQFDVLSTTAVFVYQLDYRGYLKGMPGALFVVPIVLRSEIENNNLGITSSGGGFGSLGLGFFFQFDSIMRGDRQLFVHRPEISMSIPSGKNKFPRRTINPGTRFFYLSPNWSATFYFTRHLSVSWRLHYLWCGKSPKTKVQPGDAFHMNYSLQYELVKDFYPAISGYYLQQIHDSKLCDEVVPNSKERVFAIGPASAYFFSQDIVFFNYLYFESKVRNRTKGIKFLLRFVVHF